MQVFEPFVNLAIVLFRLAGFCIIVWGGARTVYYFLMPSVYPTVKNTKTSLGELLRIELGQKIVFGLEFLVAGDILLTLKEPELNELYRLGLLVVIRTLLSYFVGREVKESDVHIHQMEREALAKSVQKAQAKK
ncbi:MAG: DUF1622 domain-containing protein [Patescibacteria group bacterium]